MTTATPTITSFSATFKNKNRTLIARDGSFLDYLNDKAMPKRGVHLDSFPMEGGQVEFEWTIDGDALVDLVVHSDGFRVRELPPLGSSKKTFTDLTENGKGSYTWKMVGGHASLYADLRLYEAKRPGQLVCARTILGFTNAPVGGISIDVSPSGSAALCRWKVQGVGTAPVFLLVTTSTGQTIGALRPLRKRGEARTQGDITVDLGGRAGQTISFQAVVLGQPQDGYSTPEPFNVPGEGPIISAQKATLSLPVAVAKVPLSGDFQIPALNSNDPLTYEYSASLKKGWPFGAFGTIDVGVSCGISGTLTPAPGLAAPTDRAWWAEATRQVDILVTSPLGSLLADACQTGVDRSGTWLGNFEAFTTKIKTETDLLGGKTSTTSETVIAEQTLGELVLSTPKMKELGMKPFTLALKAYAVKGSVGVDKVAVKAVGISGSATAEAFGVRLKNALGTLDLKVTVVAEVELAAFDLDQTATTLSVSATAAFGTTAAIVGGSLLVTSAIAYWFDSLFQSMREYNDFEKVVARASKAFDEALKASLNAKKAPNYSDDIESKSAAQGIAVGRRIRDGIHDAWAKGPPSAVKEAMGSQDFETFWRTFVVPEAKLREIAGPYRTRFEDEFKLQLLDRFIQKNVIGYVGNYRMESKYAEALVLKHYVGDELFAYRGNLAFLVITAKGAQRIPPSIARWYLSLPVREDTNSYGRWPIQGRDPGW